MPIKKENVPILIDENMVLKNFRKRPKDSHKGMFGRLLNISGSCGMLGASILSSMSALKCGVGVLDIGVIKSLYHIEASQVWESVYTLLEENSLGTISVKSLSAISESLKLSTACLIGCGLGVNDDTKFVLYDIVKNSKVPLLIDADGLNIISENLDILRNSNCPIILTPHPKEMSRLLNTSIKNIKENRVEIAQYFSCKYEVTLVLKGYKTLIASPDGKLLVNHTGNPGMSKAGSGDVLSGMIASFLAQGMEPLEAAYCGVWIHGVAGDRCSSRYSEISMLPRDIINEISKVFSLMNI